MTTRRRKVQSAPYRSLKQIRGFDGIRGVGVLIVFCSHLEVILPIATVLVVPGGTVSLDMFFVMSGFLITTLLSQRTVKTKHDRISIRYFYLAPRVLAPLCLPSMWWF